MTARKKMIDVPFDIPIPLLLDEHFTVFNCSSYSRGYHAYKGAITLIWNPLLGDDSLICELEESNEHDKYAVAIVFDDCLLKKVVGHVPLYWNKLAFKFLQFQNHSIRVAVTGKRVNIGAGLGLEIPVDYYFYGDSRFIAWLKNSIEKLDRSVDEKAGKCVK